MANETVSIEAKAPDPTSPAGGPEPMQRKLSTDETRCSVTFWLPKAGAGDAATVAVAGSFNDWSLESHPMAKTEEGDFILVIDLEAGREHEFRFILDGTYWENAWNADSYVWSDFAQCENSVVAT